MTVRSFGLEEELLLVEPGNGHPRAVAETALRDIKHADADGDDPGGGADGAAAQSLEFELQRQQLETNTKPCHDLGELGREVRRCRSLAAAAAARAGARVAALATSPFPVVPQLVRHGRYLDMARAFGLTANEQLTCGCHVHVEVDSPEEGVAVLDRIGGVAARLAGAQRELAVLAGTGHGVRQRQRTELLRLASWRASRSGLADDLLSPLTGLPESAGSVVGALLEHVRDALDQAGDTDTVTELLAAVLARGTGAAFQRGAYRDGNLSRMIDSAATATIG